MLEELELDPKKRYNIFSIMDKKIESLLNKRKCTKSYQDQTLKMTRMIGLYQRERKECSIKEAKKEIYFKGKRKML